MCLFLWEPHRFSLSIKQNGFLYLAKFTDYFKQPESDAETVSITSFPEKLFIKINFMRQMYQAVKKSMKKLPGLS